MTRYAIRLKEGLLLIALALSLFLFTSMSLCAQDAAPASGFVASHPTAPATAAHRPPNSDTLSYWYGSDYHTPFVFRPNSGEPANIVRNSLEYKHADSWALGSNFVDLMLAKSNLAEPSAGGGDGAMEAYVTLRSNFGLNEVAGTRAFDFGPIRNVSAEIGANLQTKNSSFAPSERTLYFGPNVEIKIPRGYFKVGLHFRKEWVHEGPSGKVADYDPNFNIEPSWLLPFSIRKAHLTYSGFADYNTPKGKDTFGTETAPEFLIRNFVSLDLGSLMLKRVQLVELSGGLWYWHNEYGKPPSVPGSSQTTPIIGLTFHLNGGRSMQGK